MTPISSRFVFSRRLMLVAAAPLVLAALFLSGAGSAQAQNCPGSGFTSYYPNTNGFAPGSEQYWNDFGHFMQDQYGSDFGGTGSCSAAYDSSGTGSLDPWVALIVDPGTITAGGSSMLSWISGNTTSCSVNQGIGSVSAPGGGSRPVSPPQTTSYTITCTQAATGTNVSASATLVVTAALTPPAATLQATPATIAPGDSSTLTWTSSNATSCSINQGIGSVTPNAPGSRPVSPAQTTTYTITCDGVSGQQASAYAVVTVNAPIPPSTTGLHYSCNAAGTSMTMSWDATPGATGYFARLDDPTNSCGGDWYCQSPYDQLTSLQTATSVTYPMVPNRNFTFWVHGNNAAGYSVASALAVMCPGPTQQSLTCTPSTTALPPSGGSVTYTASGASSPYGWNDAQGGSYGTGASVTRTLPAVNGTYAMTVSKSGYSSDTCYVTVGGVSCGNASAQISANPNRVRADNNSGTTLTFSASGVDTGCTISGPGVNQPVTPTACSVPSTILHTPQITAQSVYRINCDNGEGTAEAIVNLIPKFIEF